MIDGELPGGAREALDDLKTSRGSCPPAERLVEYAAMIPAERERAPEHAHIQICSRCQLVLLHLAEPEAESRKLNAESFMRWALPLAAIAILAVGASLVSRRAGVESPIDSVRGSELQPIGPAGTILGTPTFRWQSPLKGVTYRIIVSRGSTIIWIGRAETTEATPPSQISFEPGAEYTWKVEAIDQEGEVRMTSPPQTFVIS